MPSPSYPPGTVAPHSLSLRQPFHHSRSFPLSFTSATTTTSFGKTESYHHPHPSEYLPRHQPIPESWTQEDPVPSSSPPPPVGSTEWQTKELATSLFVPVDSPRGSGWGCSGSTVVDSFLHPDHGYHHDQGQVSFSTINTLEVEVEVEDGHHLGLDYDSGNHAQIQTQTPSCPGQAKTPDHDLLLRAINNLQAHAHAQPRISATRNTHSISIPSYRPPHAISPFRILNKNPSSISIPTSSAESGFDTPLSERQRIRRAQIAAREVQAKIALDEEPDEMPSTPTPVGRGGGEMLIRSGSKFSSLDDGDHEVEVGDDEHWEGTKKEKRLWSPELEDLGMGLDDGGDKCEDYGSDTSAELWRDIKTRGNTIDTDANAAATPSIRQEGSFSHPPGLTPIEEVSEISTDSPSLPSDASAFKSEFEVEDEEEASSDEEDYPSSPYRPDSHIGTRYRSGAATRTRSSGIPIHHPYSTRTRPISPSGLQDDIEEFRLVSSGSSAGSGDKGSIKADEFRAYLFGPRNHRDPRFDLKLFHWVDSGCEELRWAKRGTAIEIKNVSSFYKNVLHKEVKEKKGQQGKVATKADLPGPNSFERQLSGYGFKRTTIGKSMVIERPDLRESNRALFRKVQQVWDVIENGTFEPKVKTEKPTDGKVSWKKRVKELQAQLEDKEFQMAGMMKLLTALLETGSIDPILLAGDLVKLAADLEPPLPPDILSALQHAAIESAPSTMPPAKDETGRVTATPAMKRATAPGPKLPLSTHGRAPLLVSRNENLDMQPTPVRSLEDEFTTAIPSTLQPGTVTIDKLKPKTKLVEKQRADLKHQHSKKRKSDENENDPDSTQLIGKTKKARIIKPGHKSSKSKQAKENKV